MKAAERYRPQNHCERQLAFVESEKSLSVSLSAYGKARSTVQATPLDAWDLWTIQAYWRACKYLALGMLYLQDNPLANEALKPGISRTAVSDIGDQRWPGLHV